MGKEIERKFLVSSTAWLELAEADIRILQFYLAAGPGRTVRVRISDGTDAKLTLKFGSGARERDEFEYPIPIAEAVEMRDFAIGRFGFTTQPQAYGLSRGVNRIAPNRWLLLPATRLLQSARPFRTPSGPELV